MNMRELQIEIDGLKAGIVALNSKVELLRRDLDLALGTASDEAGDKASV